MADRIINTDSIPFLEKFFDNHKLFYVTDFPWQIFNAESQNAFSTINNTSSNLTESIWNSDDNSKLRYKWLCEEYGLFNTIRNEKNHFFRILEYALNKDNPYTLRQRRYLTQQLVEFNGVSNNPIHFSIKPKIKNAVFDLDNYVSCRNFEMVCHPGATRGAAHTFLRSNAKKLFLYINKKYFDDMEFKYSDNVIEIKKIDNLTDYFTPNFKTDVELMYNFTSNDPDDSYKNNMKYHTQTECNVLKLFEIKKIARDRIARNQKQKFLKTETFQSDALSDNYNISNILTNAPLTVYSNHEEKGRVESYLLKNRNKLLDKNFKDRHGVHSPVDLVAIHDYMYAHRPKFHNESEEILYGKIEQFFGKLRDLDVDVLKNNLFDEYRFDLNDKYIEIKNDFSKIVKTNDYKGYAIWIDKDVVRNMDREVFEFLYLVRNDIAITKTKNNKVAIINCEHEDWKTNELNSKSIWIIEDSFACKEEE